MAPSFFGLKAVLTKCFLRRKRKDVNAKRRGEAIVAVFGEKVDRIFGIFAT